MGGVLADCTAAHRVAVVDQLCIGVIVARADERAVADYRRAWSSIEGNTLGQLVVLPPTLRVPPTEGFRTEVAAMIAAEARCEAMAYVVELSGFLGATARAVITAISMLSAGRVPQRVFSSTAPALDWIASRGPRFDRAAAEAQLEALRAR